MGSHVHPSSSKPIQSTTKQKPFSINDIIKLKNVCHLYIALREGVMEHGLDLRWDDRGLIRVDGRSIAACTSRIFPGHDVLRCVCVLFFLPLPPTMALSKFY